MAIIFRTLLYGIAVGLLVYLVRNIVRDKKLTTADAVALLGTVIALILTTAGPSSSPLNSAPTSIPIATATGDAGTEQVAIATATGGASTEQVAIATATAVASRALLEYGPTEGDLVKFDKDSVVHNADVNLEDFISSARFFNPIDKVDGSWSYGFIFRDYGSGYYLFMISSRKDWVVIHSENSQDTTLANKRYEDLQISPGGHNDVSLVVKDTKAIVFINNTYLGTVDLPQPVLGGTITVGAGFYLSDEIGVRIRFEDFSIWSVE